MKKTVTVTPFLPYVTTEQVLAYDPARPETHTASPLVNAVCEVLAHHPTMLPVKIAESLALDAKHLTCALKVACGLNTSELRTAWLINLCRQFMAENPKWKLKDLMKILGLHSSTSMWRFVQANKEHFPEATAKEMRKQKRAEELRRRTEEAMRAYHKALEELGEEN